MNIYTRVSQGQSSRPSSKTTLAKNRESVRGLMARIPDNNPKMVRGLAETLYCLIAMFVKPKVGWLGVESSQLNRL
jgi:hypothetical protein